MRKFDYLSAIIAAIDFIEANLQTEISVQSVTETTEFSNWQFQRIFRAYVGDTIGNYLRIRRLTEAAEFLVNHPEKRILDVAINYQFGSQEAFTRAFKSQFSVTPANIRTSPEFLRLFKKPVLSRQMLEHIQTGLEREPKVLGLAERYFTGLCHPILSPLGEKIDYTEIAPQLWKEFGLRRKEIKNRKPGLGYGIIIDPNQNMLSHEMLYMAAVEVTSIDLVPDGMKSLVIPAQMYAVFENVGRADKTASTIDYIYALWLQNQKYKRAIGYDYEVFDNRYDLDNPESISTYFLPIALV